MSANLENLAMATGLEKSVFISIPKKGRAKECSNYQTIALTSHASKVMLRILQAKLQHTWMENFQIYKLGFEKAQEPEVKLPAFAGSQRKQGNSRKKHLNYFFIEYPEPLTGWIIINSGKFLKRWEYQTTLPVFWETCLWVKNQQLEPYMEQWTGSKFGKE